MVSTLGTPAGAQRQQTGEPLSATVRARKNVGPLDAWLSIGLGAAAVLYGVLRRSPASLAMAGIGGYLVARGVTRHDPLYAALRLSTATPTGAAISTVERSITINRPALEVYGFWHELENLPRFIRHLVSVRVTAPGRSHWVARAPFGRTVAWDAELTDDLEPRVLSWRSLPGSHVANAGSVRFVELSHGRGTVVSVWLEYVPPAGPFGAAAAFLAGEEPHEQVADALRRLKQLLEAGEIATVQGQPTGKRSLLMNALHAYQRTAR